ncbi:MAG TPA: DUF2203 domain-containing protein [Phycisphaerae bacterium]|nr:DUF2203 domain-containing protein [Phycisphaerae bacterium]
MELSSRKRKQHQPTQRRYFTLAQARSALVLVGRIAQDIQKVEQKRRELVEKSRKEDIDKVQPNEIRDIERAFESLTEQMAHLVEELADIGVELKDPGRGLVDFPAMFDGREIDLCWQIGEPTINYWHEINAGFAGRRNVAELEPVAAH